VLDKSSTAALSLIMSEGRSFGDNTQGSRLTTPLKASVLAGEAVRAARLKKGKVRIESLTKSRSEGWKVLKVVLHENPHAVQLHRRLKTVTIEGIRLPQVKIDGRAVTINYSPTICSVAMEGKIRDTVGRI